METRPGKRLPKNGVPNIPTDLVEWLEWAVPAPSPDPGTTRNEALWYLLGRRSVVHLLRLHHDAQQSPQPEPEPS